GDLRSPDAAGAPGEGAPLGDPRATGADAPRDRAGARRLTVQLRGARSRIIRSTARCTSGRSSSGCINPAELSRSSARRVIEWVRVGDSPANRENKLRP